MTTTATATTKRGYFVDGAILRRGDGSDVLQRLLRKRCVHKGAARWTTRTVVQLASAVMIVRALASRRFPCGMARDAPFFIVG